MREDARCETPLGLKEVDETETDIMVAIIAAGATLLGGGALAAFITTRFQRKQHHQETLLPPAQHFSEAAVKGFARLRTVKPPTTRTHRNFCLLGDRAELGRRLEACECAIDEVRTARGAVRVLFAPTDEVVVNTARTLYAQRLMLEVAQDFYRDCRVEELGATKPEEVERLWQLHEPRASNVYRALRDKSAWPAVNQFQAEIRRHLRRGRLNRPSHLPAPEEPEKVRDAAVAKEARKAAPTARL